MSLVTRFYIHITRMGEKTKKGSEMIAVGTNGVIHHDHMTSALTKNAISK